MITNTKKQRLKSLGLVHWDDPEGWYGEGGDRGDLVEKKESPKGERAVKPVISLPSKNGY